MGHKTNAELLKEWRESGEYADKKREADAIKKDISAARTYIADALARYRKKKLNAKSKAAAETTDPFAELADYNSEKDLMDAYGWEFITEAQKDYLINLWRLRENRGKREGKYTDRITEMMERAINGI